MQPCIVLEKWPLQCRSVGSCSSTPECNCNNFASFTQVSLLCIWFPHHEQTTWIKPMHVQIRCCTYAFLKLQ